jgi:hypothetical protein
MKAKFLSWCCQGMFLLYHAPSLNIKEPSVSPFLCVTPFAVSAACVLLSAVLRRFGVDIFPVGAGGGAAFEAATG